MERLFTIRNDFANTIVKSPKLLSQLAKRSRVFLLLRSFQADNTRTVDDMASVVALPTNPLRYLVPKVRSVEARITEAMEAWGAIFAVGPPGEAEPTTVTFKRDALPAFVSAGEEWFHYFEILAEQAAAIIVFPSGTAGCLQELNWILTKGSLEKCVFVMPPEQLSPLSTLIAAYTWGRLLPENLILPILREGVVRQSAYWTEAKNECAKLNLELPVYDRHGLLFSFGADRELKRAYYGGRDRMFTYKISGRRFILRTTLKTLVLGRIPATPPKEWES